MKRVLWIALMLTTGAATVTQAQVPYFQVYFDPDFHTTGANCGTPTETIDLYVVMHNFNTLISGANFSIDFPASLAYLGETYPAATLVLGTADAAYNGPGTGGELIGFAVPQNGFQPILVTTLHCIWTSSCECGPSAVAQAVVVRGYKYNDPEVGTAAPEGVESETYNVIPAVGMASWICAIIGTEQSTWGAVKALYR